jgi:hypothetical protein
VEPLLAHHNEARSMRFYCAVGALLPPELIGEAVAELERRRDAPEGKDADLKATAKAIKAALQGRATRAGVDLRLRRKPG